MRTYLPKLLTSILTTDALQNLRATGVLVHEAVHLVDAVVDDDVQALVDGAVLLDVVGGELLRHAGLMRYMRCGWWGF